MFKRLLTWWKTRKQVPDNARWVIESNRWILVTPPVSKVKIEPTVLSLGLVESRQNYINRNPRASLEARAREWQINQLPDECAFL